MNALSPIVLADAIEWQKPARRGERWPVALSTALHGALIVTALILLHPEPQALDLAGASVEVELIATQTVSSNAASTTSDAAVDMVSAGGEAVAPVTSETTEAVEPVETVESTPAELAEPVLVAAVPAIIPAAETLRPVEEPAPVPQQRPKKSAPKRPQQAGNSGNSAADAKASAPSGGPKATGQPGNGAAVTKYPGQVLAKLRRALRYPSGGRGTGEVSVQFTVSATGGASGVHVVKSSGSPVFDKAAVETVRRAAPFPPIPPEAGRNTWTFTMPLGFVR